MQPLLLATAKWTNPNSWLPCFLAPHLLMETRAAQDSWGGSRGLVACGSGWGISKKLPTPTVAHELLERDLSCDSPLCDCLGVVRTERGRTSWCPRIQRRKRRIRVEKSSSPVHWIFFFFFGFLLSQTFLKIGREPETPQILQLLLELVFLSSFTAKASCQHQHRSAPQGGSQG